MLLVGSVRLMARAALTVGKGLVPGVIGFAYLGQIRVTVHTEFVLRFLEEMGHCASVRLVTRGAFTALKWSVY
jgi:hypothetical protein